MSAWFYWNALKRYWWLVILPVVVISAALIGIDSAQGPQYQSTMFFLVNSPYSLTAREYSRAPNSRQSGVSDDQISAVFDFANLANSLQVADKTIQDLKLPVSSALDLLKPPLFNLKAPSVKVAPGAPSGDAANQGFLTEILGLQTTDPTKLQALSRWVELTALAYNPKDAEEIAKTYAKNALELYKTVQTRAATQSEGQVKAHTQVARQQLDSATAQLSEFEKKNQLLNGGAEFQTAQTTLENLRRDRTNLVAGVGGQEITKQRIAELDEQIAAAEQEVDQVSAQAGNAQAKQAGARAAAQADVTSAQSEYSQALQTYDTAEKEVSLARAQGFPSTLVTEETRATGASQSSSTTTQNEPGTSTVTNTTQNGSSTTNVQQQSGYTTTSKAEQSASEDLVTNIETNTSTDTDTGSSTTTSSQSSSQTSTVPAANRATTTTTTTTLPDIKTSSTTTLPTTTSSSTATSGPRTITSTAKTSSDPVTTSVKSEAPTAIQSEEQGLAYAFGLAQMVDQSAAKLQAAQNRLAAVESNDPSVALNNKLGVARENLNALRSARASLLRVDADPAAGLKALDAQVADQEKRVENLTAIAPEYRRLNSNVDRARSGYEEALQLSELYNRLRTDAGDNSGVQSLVAPYTMKVPSKLPLVLAFGIFGGLLFGISLAFGAAYIGHLRSLGPPREPIQPEVNGAGPEGERVPAYASTTASPHSSSQGEGLPVPG